MRDVVLGSRVIPFRLLALAPAVLLLSLPLSTAYAAAPAAPASDTEQLHEVVVTGSLIPQTEKETAQPLTIITADDLTQKGFSSVAEALQHTSFATGSVQGPQFVNGFTPGAETLSLFGLSPAYTKFLIDGRPIADYPALYNGTDIITSISGIPNVLIDHIDILPGGQSSIYSSDAIAGVVNINLKKKMDGGDADLRYGWTKDGGGAQRLIGLADGFSVGNLNAVVGGQYEKIDPIWGYQRDMTKQYFAGNPNSPQVAERDWLVIGNPYDFSNTNYQFLDPTNCAGVASQFGGTIGERARPGRSPAGNGGPGFFCGTYSSGYYTLNNGQENTQGYLNATYDVNSNIQLFVNTLLSHEVIRFNTGGPFYSSADSSSSPLYYFEDPFIASQFPTVAGEYLNVQRVFSPEEIGNLDADSNKDTTNSVRTTAGVQGGFGASNWKYLVDFTYTQNKLSEATFLAFTNEIEAFFAAMAGPQMGFGPGGQPAYNFNWAQFYSPITPAQYASFTGYATSYSKTWETLTRAEVTNSSLFHLPGGDAGLALLLEGGHQSWQYAPDPRFLNGGTYLYTAVAGEGHRNRSAGTTELRLPVVDKVTVDLSARYDDYQLPGQSVTKATYNLGLEYRPLKTLLFRGRYGTAFKAPTLSDEFQGQSGFFVGATDYYWCDTHGFRNNLANCPQNGPSVFGVTEGNPSLKPINANVWSGGVVWSPVERSAFAVDYMYWHIKDEVQEASSDQLLRTEAACLEGQLNPTSPTCVVAIADVTRDPVSGLITQINTPKENLSEENLEVLVFKADYVWDLGSAGSLRFDTQYNHTVKHNFVQFPGDPQIDYLTQPFYSTEFRDKGNAAITWDYHKFSTTVYGEYYGTSPNNQAIQDVTGYAQPNAYKLQPWWIGNWSASYKLLPGLVVTFNVNNVFNKQPPFDPTYLGTSNQPYDIFNYNDYGRSYFLGANYKFNP